MLDAPINEIWDRIVELDPNARIIRSNQPEPRTFYVSTRLEIKDGSILGSVPGYAPTPQLSVARVWQELSEGLVVIDAMKPSRREVRWNPYLKAWRPASEPFDATHLITGDNPS